MKSIKFVTCLITAATLLFAACEKTNENKPKQNPYQDTKMDVTVTVKSVSGNEASIQVKHNGAVKLTWYGFLTEDIDTPLADLVEANASALNADDLVVGATKTIALADLETETDYRYVAFGVAVEDDGTVWTYGKPGEATFKTSKDLNVIFSLSEPVVNRNAATLTLSYDVDEDEAYTWYGFLTTDVSSTAANLIKTKVKNIPADQLKSGSGVEIALEDLEFSSTYRYVVTGLLEDGRVYGTPADVMFQIGDMFSLEPSWTMSYSRDDVTYPDYPHKFTNTVAAGSTAGKYYMTLFSSSEIEDTSNLPAFIESIIDDLIEYLQETVEEDSRYSSISDLLSSGTNSEWYRLGYKTYYMFAIGLTDDAEPTGKYAFVKMTNEPDEEAKAAYESWLGNWFLGADLIPITVSEGEKYVSYKVEGFLSDLVSGGFLASFNASTEGFDFYSQSCEEYNHTTYGPVDLQLNGCQPRSDGGYQPISGSYTIGSAAMSADGLSADITPNSISLSDGTEVTLSGMNYYGHILSGQYAGYYLTYSIAKDPVLFPTTMVRPSETGSEAYNKWLGSWQIQRPEYTETTDTVDGEPTGNMITDTWVIEQDFADRSYIISGIDGYGGESVKAEFDSATGGLSVSEQAMGSFEQDGATYYKYLFGLFENNESIWGGSEKIFSGTINSDGTATLTGLEFSGETSDGVITDTFTGMELFVVDASDTIKGFGADNWGEFYTYPCNITKQASSGTSIRMKKTSGRQVSLKRTQHVFKPFSNSDLIFGYRRSGKVVRARDSRIEAQKAK